MGVDKEKISLDKKKTSLFVISFLFLKKVNKIE